MKLSLPVFFLFFVIGPRLHAATFFIAPTGDDSQTGSQESPFATVQRAQAAAAPGDTVYLRGGTYTMEERLIAKKHGLWAYATYLD